MENLGVSFMKKTGMLLLVFLFFISLSVQGNKEVKVSNKTKKEFARLYPNVKDVKWFTYPNSAEGTFIQKGKQIVAIFKADQLFATKTEIDKAALPELVKKHLSQKYQGFSIISASKIHFFIKALKDNDHYAADITNRSRTLRVLCYPNGVEESVSNLQNNKKN